MRIFFYDMQKDGEDTLGNGGEIQRCIFWEFFHPLIPQSVPAEK